jgi:hypothetical protein
MRDALPLTSQGIDLLERQAGVSPVRRRYGKPWSKAFVFQVLSRGN